MRALPEALAALAQFRQFVLYKLAPRPGQAGKTDKYPLDSRIGRVADAHNPTIWLSADEAIQAAQQYGEGHGVGFVFTADDPFWFLDIDHCLIDGPDWSPLAKELTRRLAGAAVEISQSGQGLHIVGTGQAPEHGCRRDDLGLEFYTEGRFVALTGTQAVGDAGRDLTDRLPELIADFFPSEPTDSRTDQPAEWTTGPDPEWSGPEDDDELIRRITSGESTAQLFGTRCPVSALWHADPERLGQHYPDHNAGRAYDESSADAALAAHLAFWTGRDCERIERLMRRSALARDKWDRHRTYLRRTILGAVSRCQAVYGSRKAGTDSDEPESEAQVDGPEGRSQPEMMAGIQYMPAQQQLEYFAGCVYVQDVHRVLTPKGALLKRDQFKAVYGGYLFALDAMNDKNTKDAWEAFVESQAVRWPKAEGVTFRPDREPGDLLTEEGRVMVNTYKPIPIPRAAGDVEPFLRHLRTMMPDPTDREIFVAYMAACVQHKGVKFQWAPLLQGVQGNGKTLYTRCVAHAVGLAYSFFPKAEEVGNRFNSWMLDKLFIGIEDVYYPDHRREVIEALKPLITNDWQPIELKGVDQINARVCANFILNSNHRDAIRKTRDDRRFAIFFTEQQTVDDLTRDGLDGDYFPDLYAWLRGEGPYAGQPSGYAIVAEYLHTYDIPDEYNPAGALHRAPKTSSHERVLAEGLGTIEQEILEAVDEGRAGFADGWISSRAVDQLIEQHYRRGTVPPNKRREILQGLGYDWHPALHNGRVNTPIQLDGGKPKLFIHKDSPERELQTASEVVQAYLRAQESGGATEAERVFGPSDER